MLVTFLRHDTARCDVLFTNLEQKEAKQLCQALFVCPGFPLAIEDGIRQDTSFDKHRSLDNDLLAALGVNEQEPETVDAHEEAYRRADASGRHDRL